MVPDGHRSGARESRGKLAHCFNEIAFNLVGGQFSQNPTVLVNRDVVERPGVRIHVTADIGIFRRQPPVRCQENTGGLPPLVMVGAVRRFRNTSFMNI